MPLVYQQNINEATKIGVWHIAESEDFFLHEVPLHRDITHPHKRLQHLAGRLLLKELYPDFPYGLIRIADTRKPFLEDELYHFSISHCGDYAAAIVSSKNRVGVDIELITEKTARVKHKFLTAAEQAMILGIADSDSPLDHSQLLTAAWSIKETLYKWEGRGELDFKEHMQILEVENISQTKYEARCLLTKSTTVALDVYFKFLHGTVLSWCVK